MLTTRHGEYITFSVKLQIEERVLHMSQWLDEALKKLSAERAEGKKLNRYSGVMADPVGKQLEDFCRQDDEFAQAVVQGGTFKDCMEAVTKNVGSSISDVDAYRRAVQFYFPGAEVRVKMSVDLIGAAAEEQPEEKKGMLLDLADFL